MAEGAMLLQRSWLPRPQAYFQALPRRRLLPLSFVAVRQDFPPSSLTITSIEDVGGEDELTARERRHLRNERRESRAAVAGSWREEIEERLMVKPKKIKKSWTEDLNLDNLALLGPQWWIIRVSRLKANDTAGRLARAFVRNYPDREFKLYTPAVKVKRKLKNGTISIKPRPIFPGCVFLYCVLNKEIHDFVRECNGVGGFLGTKVGNIKRQINRPKPVPADEVEAIFKRAEEEQELADQEFLMLQASEISIEDFVAESSSGSILKTNSTSPTKQKRKSGKNNQKNDLSSGHSSLVPGASVKVLSGPFANYTGRLKEVSRKTRKATVGFKLFGKESFVELEFDQIVSGE